MVDQVTFAPAPTGATPPPAPSAERPAWKPEGFEGDEAAIAKSWADQRAEITRLQQELAKRGEPPPQETPDPAAPKPPEGDDKAGKEDDAAKKVADAAGVDLNPYQQEFSTTGDVSADNRAKIADSLKSVLGENAREIVDQFIDARKVVVQNDNQMYMDAAGGEQNYGLMTEWAKTSLPPEQLEAYNRQVESGDRHTILFAIDGLKAKYEAANGKLPNLIPASRPGAPIVGFRSTAEMRRAMADPRYKTDAAYREEVKAKLAASPF